MRRPTVGERLLRALAGLWLGVLWAACVLLAAWLGVVAVVYGGLDQFFNPTAADPWFALVWGGLLTSTAAAWFGSAVGPAWVGRPARTDRPVVVGSLLGAAAGAVLGGAAGVVCGFWYSRLATAPEHDRLFAKVLLALAWAAGYVGGWWAGRRLTRAD